MSVSLTIEDVRDLVENDEAPLKYLSLRMGQRPFWALYFECHPEMRGQSPAITTFTCPPGLPVTLEPLFGREGYSMDVADQYYADIEAGVITKPEEKAMSPEEEAQVLTGLRDFLNQATEAGALPGQPQAAEVVDDDPEELERLRAETLAELDVAHAKLEAAKRRVSSSTQPRPKGCATAAVLILAITATFLLL